MKYNDNGIWKDLTVKVSDTLPIGTVIPFAGNTVPSDWMVCDGSAISRTVYSTLFGVIGTSFGEGDGSTTFNIPDLRGKVVVGADSEDTDFDTLGETGGEKTHLQTQTENYWNYRGDNPSASSGGTHGYLLTHNNNQTAFNVLQPYQVVNYIIKATKTVTGEYISETLPIGTELEFNGEATDIPDGWEQTDGNAKIIWTNSSPNSSFGDQTITLDESLANYDFYEIHFLSELGLNEYIISSKVKTGYACNIFQGWCATGTGVSGRARSWQYTSATQIHFDNAIKGSSINNNHCIPLYVVGYKTDLLS